MQHYHILKALIDLQLILDLGKVEKTLLIDLPMVTEEVKILFFFSINLDSVIKISLNVLVSGPTHSNILEFIFFTII